MTPTPEQIDEEISKWAGWNISDKVIEGLKLWYLNGDPLSGRGAPLEYHADLNYCHAAEAKMTEEQWETYADEILYAADNNAAYSIYSATRTVLKLTPTQRATAIARVVAPELFQ